MSVKISVSNEPYSSIGGLATSSIKNVFITEGENLVNVYNYNFYS